MRLVSVLSIGILLFGVLDLALDSFTAALGQALLPEAGTNGTIDQPNTNATISNESDVGLPDPFLKPLFN